MVFPTPQGQAIVERAHLTIKQTLLKQEGGIGDTFQSPKDKLNTILFILNFLTLDKNGQAAAERHSARMDSSPKPLVLWKDILTGQWKGPDPVLIWSRGSVCVFPQDKEVPIWVPERLVRKASENEDEDRGSRDPPTVVGDSDIPNAPDGDT